MTKYLEIMTATETEMQSVWLVDSHWLRRGGHHDQPKSRQPVATK